jgi:AsmA protein
MEIELLLKRVYLFLISPRGKKYFRYAAIAFVALIIAGLLLPHFYSHSYLKQQIKVAAQERLGRQVTIAGDIKARVFPWPGVDASNITISNPPAYSGIVPLAKIKEMHVDFSLSKLLQAQIEAQYVQLVDANFNLYINNQGGPNWLFKDQQAGLKKWQKENKDTTYNNFEQVMYLIKSIPFGVLPPELVLTDSAINYMDEASPQQYSFTAINNTIIVNQGDEGVNLKGSGFWNHDAIDWYMSASNKRAFESRERSSIKISYASRTYSLGLTGSIERDTYTGRANLVATSLRNILPWLSEYAPFDSIVSPLEFSFNAESMECTRSYCNFIGNFQLDKLKGRSNTKFRYSSQIPSLVMDLELKQADFTSLFPAPRPANMLASPLSDLQDAEKGHSIWSAKPFKLDALGLIESNITLRTKQLSLNDIKFGRGTVQLITKDKAAEFNITDMEMYSGKGTVSIGLDYSQVPYKWSSVTNLSNTNLDSIMTYWLGIRGLHGRSNLLLNLKAEGDTLHQLVSSVDGNGILNTKGGRIKGADLSTMFRNIPQAFKVGGTSKHSTEFDTLNANFIIKDGVLVNSDMLADSRFLKFSGNGKIDFANYNIDYLLTPQKVIKLNSSAGAGNMVNYPIRVKGPLAAPDFIPNLQLPIKNPSSNNEKKAAGAAPKDATQKAKRN